MYITFETYKRYNFEYLNLHNFYYFLCFELSGGTSNFLEVKGRAHDFPIHKKIEATQQSETRSTLLIRQKRALLPFKFIYKKTLGQVVNTYKVGAREARASL